MLYWHRENNTAHLFVKITISFLQSVDNRFSMEPQYMAIIRGGTYITGTGRLVANNCGILGVNKGLIFVFVSLSCEC